MINLTLTMLNSFNGFDQLCILEESIANSRSIEIEMMGLSRVWSDGADTLACLALYW